MDCYKNRIKGLKENGYNLGIDSMLLNYIEDAKRYMVGGEKC